MTPAVVFALLTAAGGARAGEPLSLEGCWAAALARSETVAQQRELTAQAQEHVTQAVGSVVPNVSAVGSYLVQQTPPSGLASTLSPSTQPFAKLTATQPLFQGFREFAGLRAAKKLVTAQAEAERQAEVQLYQDVAAAFYAVLSAERSVATFATELKAYDDRIAELDERVRVGRSRLSDILATRTARATLTAQAEQARGALLVARDTLAFLTGAKADVALSDEPADAPAPASLDDYLGAVDARPDVKSASARLDSARDGVSFAEGAYWPTVGLTGNYYLKRTGSLQDVKWDAQLALTVPLFTGGVNTSRVREAKSQVRQDEAGLSLARRGAEQELRTAWARYTADFAQVAALRTAVDLADKTYQQQKDDYRLGLANNLDVLTALASLQEVQRALDGARYLVLADRARLEAAAGRRPATTGASSS